MSFANGFFSSCVALLAGTAFAKLYSAAGSGRLLTAIDPILHLNYREIMLAAAAIELLVALYVMLLRDTLLRAFALLWLSGNFVIYRCLAKYLGVELCPCLGTLSSNLPLSQERVNQILTAVVIYFLVGSSYILHRASRENAAQVQSFLEASVLS